MCSRVLLWLNPKTALPPSCLPANNVALVHPYTPISTSPTQKGREKLKGRERLREKLGENTIEIRLLPIIEVLVLKRW